MKRISALAMDVDGRGEENEMAYIRICDLCGKPLNEIGREYKVKKRWYSGPDSGWATLECHDECAQLFWEQLRVARSSKIEEQL